MIILGMIQKCIHHFWATGDFFCVVSLGLGIDNCRTGYGWNHWLATMVAMHLQIRYPQKFLGSGMMFRNWRFRRDF